MIQQASECELVAVSSRRMSSAQEFANTHGLDNAFDSWADMLKFDGGDAIYVATPTSVKEEICVAAANHGKHVLGDKPFANLSSLQGITSACKHNDVGFMDGTHFVHHPRTAHIKSNMPELVGRPWSIDSVFQFGLTDKKNIRYNPDLEPYGAIGDVGWYCMRAAVEYLSGSVEIVSAESSLRRDDETHAVVRGSGVIVFDDGSTSTWNCGFDSGAVIMDLRISGSEGVIKLNDFVSQRSKEKPASFEHHQGRNANQVEVPSVKPEQVLMFENFAAMIGNPDRLKASIRASERTQTWLDAIWTSALRNETNS
ncbi:MAG: Gfo/Idh/MocA family oxidoreductase [Gammaproteobacteria bacterium]|nr:Gfo/Idh/MocA family oxidoreductase [Gammaproteobacteria bacterium]